MKIAIECAMFIFFAIVAILLLAVLSALILGIVEGFISYFKKRKK